MAYLFWTEFTASDIATCTIAMLRLHGLPPTFAAFIAAMAVWFQSVMTSALAGDDSAATRHTLAVVTPLTIARGIILMVRLLVVSRLLAMSALSLGFFPFEKRGASRGGVRRTPI